VREDQAGNVAPARVSPTTEKENDKKRVLGAIRRWKYIPAMSWDELRKLTREP